MSLFWTSGDVFSGFQRVGNLICVWQRHTCYVSSDSPLVKHLLMASMVAKPFSSVYLQVPIRGT